MNDHSSASAHEHRHPQDRDSVRARRLHLTALGSLLALILFGLAWELWLAPLRPGGSWLALKVLPLVLAVPGVLRRRVYTMQWTSMLILVYFVEGIVRATSDRGPSATLGWVEVALTLVYFACVLAWLRPYKQAARAAKRADRAAPAQAAPGDEPTP